HHNLFFNNNSHIVGLPGGAGKLGVRIFENDLLPATNYGVNNLTTNVVITATQNWWGSDSGPAHASNPPGQGVPVSDRVLFDPWRTSAVRGTLLSDITGLVVHLGHTPQVPAPMVGVTVLLGNGTYSTTNQSGFFGFHNLGAGTYTVRPLLNGYVFSPPMVTVNIPPDANGLQFVGSLVTGQTYQVS